MVLRIFRRGLVGSWSGLFDIQFGSGSGLFDIQFGSGSGLGAAEFVLGSMVGTDVAVAIATVGFDGFAADVYENVEAAGGRADRYLTVQSSHFPIAFFCHVQQTRWDIVLVAKVFLRSLVAVVMIDNFRNFWRLEEVPTKIFSIQGVEI